MELSKVVPWGRSLSEYRAIFSLLESDFDKKILGCGDGPACFNAELSSVGSNVISVEPVIAALTNSGIDVALVPVEYEFQKGTTEMLVAKCV